jgi:hypothetical protein
MAVTLLKSVKVLRFEYTNLNFALLNIIISMDHILSGEARIRLYSQEMT